VLKTKANVSVEELGEQYCLIGPYNESCVQMEVEVLEPYNEAMQRTLKQMRDHGLKVMIIIACLRHNIITVVTFLKYFKLCKPV